MFYFAIILYKSSLYKFSRCFEIYIYKCKLCIIMHTQISFSHTMQFTSFDAEKYIISFKVIIKKKRKDMYVHLNC